MRRDTNFIQIYKSSFAVFVLATFVQMRVATGKAQSIDSSVRSIESQVIEWRRHFHQTPELSGQEKETARYVADRLRGFGISVRTGVGGFGVVGVLDSGKPGPVLGLRADMDALPIKELSGLEFASKATGDFWGQTVDVSHACGHDGHMATLLGVAKILSQRKESFRGKVKFIFQPSEEGLSAPPPVHGFFGAKAMIKDRVLEDPKLDALVGMHFISGSQGFNTGDITFRSGLFMAERVDFVVVLTGVQSHGSSPGRGVNPISMASEFALQIDKIETQKKVVVSLGSIQGGYSPNSIPREVTIKGTVRGFSSSAIDQAFVRFDKIALELVKKRKMAIDDERIKIQISRGPVQTPAVINDLALTKILGAVLKKTVPGQFVEWDPVFGSEDFSEYQKLVPTFYFMLGSTNPAKPLSYPARAHSSYFYLDEAALSVGVKSLLAVVHEYLGEGLNNAP